MEGWKDGVAEWWNAGIRECWNKGLTAGRIVQPSNLPTFRPSTSWPSFSKSVSKFNAEGPAILFDDVLSMEWGCGVVIPLIQHIINAGRQVQSLHQVLAKESEVDDA